MSRSNTPFLLTWMLLSAVGVLVLSGAGCGGAAGSAPGAKSAHGAHGAHGANDANDEDGDHDERVAAPNSVVRKQGSGSVAAVLGPPGGTLELNEGPRVEVPPGAVQGGQEFVLKIAQKTTAFHNKESEKAIGPTFTFAPSVDAPAGRSITVSLPLGALPEGWGEPAIAYEIDEGEVAGAEDSTRTKWQYENAKVSGGRAVAELPNLAGLRLQFVLSNLHAQ